MASIVGPDRTPEILTLALSIGNAYHRAAAVKELLPYLPSAERAHALVQLSEDAIASGRQYGLGLLGSPLPVQSGLRIAEQFRDPDDRAYALASLLPSLSQPTRESLEAVIEELVSAHGDAFAEDVRYVDTLQNLSPERRLRVVTCILEQFEDDRAKISALREISPEADVDLVGPLLWCAASIEDEFDRGEALALVAEAASSGMVMSSFSATRAKRNARCGSSLACRRPPRGFGSSRPLVPTAFISFTTKETDTPK